MKPKPRASHGPQGRKGGHDGDHETGEDMGRCDESGSA